MHSDYVLTNILDLNAVEPGSLACTSCKSKENAMSRCNDCANFLCASCDNAHKYMRCFENHTVVLLEELRNSTEKVAIHKPLFCATHTAENLKYYCFNCQVPVCNDCLIADHKGAEHHYELIVEAEKRMRTDLEEMIDKAKIKVDYCNGAAGDLENALTELQNQHDTAQDIIEENFENFKRTLNRCRDNAIKDLEKLHSERELKIMDLLHNVEKSVEKLESTCKFTDKVLQEANGAEMLSLKQLIGAQFANLITNTPKVDVHYSLEFDTKFEQYEVIAQNMFGKFRTESSSSPKESTPPPTLPGMPPMLKQTNGNCNNNNNSNQGALTGSVTASSPISLPTSMQSSFEGDMLGPNFMMPPNVLSPESPMNNQLSTTVSTVVSTGNNIAGLSSIAEYNLHRLANLADNGDHLTDPIIPPSTATNSSQQFTLADLISGDQRAFNSLQQLAKLGLNNNSKCCVFTNQIHFML